jgi:hypothetical protein
MEVDFFKDEREKIFMPKIVRSMSMSISRANEQMRYIQKPTSLNFLQPVMEGNVFEFKVGPPVNGQANPKRHATLQSIFRNTVEYLYVTILHQRFNDLHVERGDALLNRAIHWESILLLPKLQKPDKIYDM